METPLMRHIPQKPPELIEYHGQLCTREEIAQRCGLKWKTIDDRVRKYRVSVEAAADMDLSAKQLYPFFGEYISVTEAARRTGFSHQALFSRIRGSGMTLEEAVEDMRRWACRPKTAPPRPAPKPAEPEPEPQDAARSAYFARMICRSIYGGAPEESDFAEVEPGRAWTFGSRHWRCRVEAQGDDLKLSVFFAETGKLSLSRRYRYGARIGGGIQMIREDGHAGKLYCG